MARTSASSVPIVNIQSTSSRGSLLDMVRQSLNPGPGRNKGLPTLVLYDDKGLQLFQDITYLDEYYLTNAEIDVLKNHSAAIAHELPVNTSLIELGSGNLRKVSILLDAFEAAKKPVEYFALDVSLSELQRTFSMLDIRSYQHVTFKGLHGTYDDAVSWLDCQKEASRGGRGHATCVLTLGSSIGNFAPAEATSFLANYSRILGSTDYMLVGLDACQDADRVFTAYNDSQHVTEDFYRNGLESTNRLLGYQAFRQEEWKIDTGVEQQKGKARHHASYVALKDIKTKDFTIRAGERLEFEESWKYSEAESDKMWRDAGLIHQMAFANSTGDYHLHLLSPAHLSFPTKVDDYAASPLPSLADWKTLWAAWDTVTKSMVPQDELLNKPIQLRNNLIFYLGHIPTFADIHFTKATSEKPTDPKYYSSIFERGIDPDVDNPEQCHDHSEIPSEWPPLDEILKYQVDVRARIIESIESGRAISDRRLSRGLWLAYEHEAMHLETFLYMLIQSDKVLPPPGHPAPDFPKLAEEAAKARGQNQWHRVPESKVVLGLDDPENNDGPDRYFGWDIERPARKVVVGPFEAQSRPISNGEYAYFLETTHSDVLPASWIAKKSTINGHVTTGGFKVLDEIHVPSAGFMAGKSVRTVYGPIPLKYALDWPVMASFDELERYAKWSNGRIPSLEEVRSIYDFAESKKLEALEKPSSLISAVNGHLSNDGVEETPPPSPSFLNVNGSKLSPRDLFVDLTGCNVGFKHWQPTAVTGSGNQLRGQGDMGGLWEWTSTPLAAFEGYKAMDLYPGYSADFFDGKHNICLGGSWATVPRIAGRRSFVNWYQHNYLYVWCTARLVRDVA